MLRRSGTGSQNRTSKQWKVPAVADRNDLYRRKRHRVIFLFMCLGCIGIHIHPDDTHGFCHLFIYPVCPSCLNPHQTFKGSAFFLGFLQNGSPASAHDTFISGSISTRNIRSNQGLSPPIVLNRHCSCMPHLAPAVPSLR